MCTSPQKISTSRIDYSFPIRQVKAESTSPHSKIQGYWTQRPLHAELWLFQGHGPWGNRAVKMFLSCRLIMNSRPLWNSHQRHKFLRAETSWDILEFRVSETPFAGAFTRYFTTLDTMLICQSTHKTGNNAVKISQAFHDMAQFGCFTDLNLFKYAFNVIHHHYLIVLISR